MFYDVAMIHDRVVNVNMDEGIHDLRKEGRKELMYLGVRAQCYHRSQKVILRTQSKQVTSTEWFSSVHIPSKAVSLLEVI